MILAGDIGGTKTHLALFEWKDDRTAPVRTESFPSKEYASLEEILEEFLAPRTPSAAHHETEASPAGPDEQPAPSAPPEPTRIAAACFGVAGPVIENRSRTTNLPWILDGEVLAKRFDIPAVRLLNDL
jgi:glucokinase